MKSKVVDQVVPDFKPVAIELTFESEDELGAFFAIMNHGTITGAVSPVLDCYDINRTVKAANDGYTPKYQSFHTKLHTAILNK